MVLTAVLTWWALCYEPAVQSALDAYTERPYFVAHSWRGSEFPMSSLALTQAAVDTGLQFIDLDVRLSSDGVPVVYHDPNLNQTTGKRGMVRDAPFAELTKMTITPNRSYRGPEQQIASLASHLEVIKAASGTPVAVIEIKDWSSEIADTAEAAVLELLRHYDMTTRSIIVTAHPLRVCAIKRKAPQQLVMNTFVDGNYERKQTHFFTLPWYVRSEPARRLLRKWCPPDALAIEKTVATGTIESVIAAGYPVFMWSLQSPREFERAHAWGVFATVGEGFSVPAP